MSIVLALTTSNCCIVASDTAYFTAAGKFQPDYEWKILSTDYGLLAYCGLMAFGGKATDEWLGQLKPNSKGMYQFLLAAGAALAPALEELSELEVGFHHRKLTVLGVDPTGAYALTLLPEHTIIRFTVIGPSRFYIDGDDLAKRVVAQRLNNMRGNLSYFSLSAGVEAAVNAGIAASGPHPAYPTQLKSCAGPAINMKAKHGDMRKWPGV